jgi:hypothetical protein
VKDVAFLVTEGSDKSRVMLEPKRSKAGSHVFFNCGARLGGLAKGHGWF